ncbi:MAG: hypothetical protein ACI3XZ_05270 [Butyricicoccus sp.]
MKTPFSQIVLFSSLKINRRYQTDSVSLIIPQTNTGDKKADRSFSGDFCRISGNFMVSEDFIEKTPYFSRFWKIAPDYSLIMWIVRQHAA